MYTMFAYMVVVDVHIYDKYGVSEELRCEDLRSPNTRWGWLRCHTDQSYSDLSRSMTFNVFFELQLPSWFRALTPHSTEKPAFSSKFFHPRPCGNLNRRGPSRGFYSPRLGIVSCKAFLVDPEVRHQQTFFCHAHVRRPDGNVYV